jgi:hypothetical protein
MILPTRRAPSRLTRDQEELHYVTWRYALEHGPQEPRIVREVLTFKRADDMHHAIMTYKLGSEDLDKVVRLFEGPVIGLGESHMCVMVAAEETSEGWDQDSLYRGRVLLMRRRPVGLDHIVRFGMLATTRADGDFEPCATCVIMLLADGVKEDIQEFRRMVTIGGPAGEIIKRDFAGLPGRDLDLIDTFLRNVPEGYKKYIENGSSGADEWDDGHDRVLRLVLPRFDRNMPRIRRWLLDPKNGSKNPIIANWKSEGALLARENEAL